MKTIRLYRIALIILAIGAALFVVSIASAATPSGASPSDPLMVPTGAQTIAPNTTLWFYFDYALSSTSSGGAGGGPGGPGGAPGGGAPRGSASASPDATVTVDANGAVGLSFGIFTQTEANAWLSDPATAPVGRGTPYTNTSSGLVTHDLYWAGGFNAAGRYFIAVSNSSASAISFRMTVTGETVTLYPSTAVATPTLYVPVTVTPAPTTTVSGKIVFETTTGGEIYTVNGDGTDLKLITHGIDPTWSADGKQIVFTRWDNTNPGVFIVNADGTNERLVFGTAKARWARMSPDGKYIVFSQDKSKSDKNIIWKLGVIDLATGKLTEPECSQLCYTPSWGKDSTTVYYLDPGVGISKTSILGGDYALVMGPSGKYWDASKNAAMPILYMPSTQNAEVNAAGTQITYAQQAHDRWEVHVVNTDGSNEYGVTTFDPVTYYLLDTAVHNTTPTWSSDGKQIMFMSDRNGKWEFFVATADGSNVQQVLKNVTDKVAVKFTYENERIMDWTRSWTYLLSDGF